MKKALERYYDPQTGEPNLLQLEKDLSVNEGETLSLFFTIETVEIRVRGQIQKERQRIWINDNELILKESLDILNKSPDGFNWGYLGSGPAQTALAICLHIFGGNKYPALTLYQAFKEAYVANWPQGEDFSITISLTDFLIINRKDLHYACEFELWENSYQRWENYDQQST